MKSAVVLALAASSLVLAASACGSDPAPVAPCRPNAAGVDTGGDLPASLHAYCMVTAEGGAIAASAGVTPYDLNTPLFSDYAIKYRTVWMPPGMSVSYAADGRFAFPVGTVITKSFGFPADMRAPEPVKWVETRVLVHGAKGWVGSSYRWNDAQTDAQVSAAGEVVSLSFVDAQGKTESPNYLVPAEAQCSKCHANDGDMTTLGPTASQLNRDFAYPTGTENELAHWARSGLLTGAPAQPSAAPRLPVYSDPSTGDTATRARAYLQANCAYCHNGMGEARTTGLDLTLADTTPYALGVCKPPVAAGKAALDEHYDIVPGHPEQSILVYRMQSTAPSVMMPELGRSLSHAEAVDLVTQWIAEMPESNCAP